MSRYLMIESQDPFDSRDVGRYYEMAEKLAKAGNKVTVFLVQNAVFSARSCGQSGGLLQLLHHGVQVLADDFSLQERGIRTEQLINGVKSTPLDCVIDALAEGAKALWH